MSKLPELRIYDGGCGNFEVAPKDVAVLTRERAEEILHRCNCHDELVAALEDTLVGIPEGIEEYERGHRNKGQAILTETFKRVEAVLANVRKS